MNVLICCEESGVLRRAFRGRGFDAWSNDLIDSADDSEFHLKMDCFDAIDCQSWDLIIMHPPCDHLALSGNRWYGKGGRDYHKRHEAIDWTVELWDKASSVSPYVALENPKSVIFSHLDYTDLQYIQPHHFGHPEFKETGLALRNLPKLTPVNPLTPPARGTDAYIEWQKVWRMAPGPDRKKLRSRTYPMIADAIADQWGRHISG